MARSGTSKFTRKAGRRAVLLSRSTRVLFKALYSAQERYRKAKAHLRSLCLKRISLYRKIQNGHSRKNSSGHTARRVGHFFRSQRRLLPRTHSPSITEVSKVHSQGSGLSFSGSATRVVNSTPGLHQNHLTHQGFSTSSGHSNPPVPGRLVNSGSLSSINTSTYSIFPRSHSAVGLDRKRGKMRTHSHPEIRFSGRFIRPSTGISFPYKSQMGKTQPLDKSLATQITMSSQGMVQNVGTTGFSGEISSTRDASSETITNSLHQKLVLPNSKSESTSAHSTTHISGPLLVEGPESRNGRHSHPFSGSRCSNIYRCLDARVGRSYRKSHDLRPVAGHRSSATHQSVGTFSSPSYTEPFSVPSTAQGSPSRNGQYHHIGLHQQTGGDTFSPNDGAHIPTVCLASGKPRSVESQTCSRSPQCFSRPAKQVQSGDQYRVVSTTNSVQKHMSALGHSPSRSLCNKFQCKASHLCVSDTGYGSLASGRFVHSMGRPLCICVSSDGHSTTSGSETTNLEMQNASSSSKLAKERLVSRATSPLRGPSTEAATQSQSSETTQIKCLSPGPSILRSSRVELIHHKLRDKGFSEQIAQRIAGPQRDSTLKVYEAKWRVFCHWCSLRKINPLNATIPIIAEFFEYLFTTKNRKPSTIEGYRTALNRCFLHYRDLKLGSDSYLSDLIANYYKERPVLKQTVPSWDLSFVLNALTRAPFEPLGSCDLKWLTYKAVFLTAFASGRRRSEIHALLYTGYSYLPNWESITLHSDPQFLAKNQSSREGGFQLADLTIPALSPIVGTDLRHDQLLCPVRALRYYIKRTEPTRQGRQKLFISLYQNLHREIQAPTISHWLKDCILYVYKNSNQAMKDWFSVRPHHIRALATSWAAFVSTPVEDILRACAWKCHNTFTQHYLRDLTWTKDQMFALGPLIAATQRVEPPHKASVRASTHRL